MVEARRKAEEDNGRLTNERMSLLMELGATKDDFTAFWERTSAEKTITTTTMAAAPLRTTFSGVCP